MRDKDGQSPCHWAATGGNLKVIQWLEKMGAYSNKRDLKGRQALYYAAKAGQVDLLKWLVVQVIA